MLNTIKAEFRKLYTIRSTYFVSALGIVLMGFVSFYVEGFRGEASLLQPDKIQNLMLSSANLLSLFAAIVAVLLIAHEYRYSTIMYTLTSSNSRTKVLIAKLIALLAHALCYTVIGVALSVLLMYIGMSFKDMSLYATQTIAWGDVIWRSLFVVLSYASLGLLLGLLFRNVVGAFITLFMMPATVEPLLGLLLKDNVKYLPFHASDQVINATNNGLSHGTAALVFGGYLAVGYIVAWILLLKRDAN